MSHSRGKSRFRAAWPFAVLVAAVFSLFGSGTVRAQSPVVMSVKGDAIVDLARHTSYYIDRSADLSLDEIMSRDDEFRPVATRYIDFGLGHFRVWLRFALHNPAKSEKTWRLDLGRQFDEELEVFEIRKGAEPAVLLRSHASDPFNARPIKMRTLACDVPVPPGETVEIYVGYKSASTTALAMKIGPPAGVATARGREGSVNALMNGALFAMVGVAFLMTPFTGWRLSAAFALYIASGILYVAHADGYTNKYLWPDGMPFNDALNMSFMLLMSACGFNFARLLFDFKKTWPAYDRFLLIYIFAALTFAIASPVIFRFFWLKVAGYVIIPIGAIIQPITGILSMRRGLSGASAYLVGGVVVVLTFVYAVLAHLVPGHFNLDMTLDVGHAALIVESFAFAGAVIIRLLNMQKERDAAKNAELVAVRQKLVMSSALREAQRQYAEVRALSARRREQLASVSHDLRQPLAMLRHKLHAAAGGDEDTANEMHKAIDYLERLAGDQIIADERENAQGQSDGSIERFSARVIFDAAREMFKGEADAKGIHLRIHPLNDEIEADAVSLMRIVANLVTNAIKNTSEGGVLLSARRRGGKLAIEVWDTGAGFRDGEIERLTQRHEKGEGSDGSGLGLAIVSEIAARYDLNFRIKSVYGKGSCARIDLPRRA